ncbi:MAG: hypothetical protein IPO92_20220 [Saprospiraceae bacterium]|nr:hypothetical protein [Saprospiraceae bacterium]
MYGIPENLTYGEELILEKIKPETLADDKHEIYFNRGVAASQAYAIRFGNLKPNDISLTEKEKQERKEWLSRGLFEALCKYIRQAKGNGWSIRAELYELDQIDVMNVFKEVKDKGADVQIVYEARKSVTQTKDNEDTLKATGFIVNDGVTTYGRKIQMEFHTINLLYC